MAVDKPGRLRLGAKGALAAAIMLTPSWHAIAQSDQVFDHLDELGRINERLQDRTLKLERENKELRERLRRYEPVDSLVSSTPSTVAPSRPASTVGGITASRMPVAVAPQPTSANTTGSISASGIVGFNSEPRGADVSTSLGSGCQTPCEMEITADRSFAVTFVHPGYESTTVDIQIQSGAAGVSGPKFLPNPVFVQLAPVTKKKPTPAQSPKKLLSGH